MHIALERRLDGRISHGFNGRLTPATHVLHELLVPHLGAFFKVRRLNFLHLASGFSQPSGRLFECRHHRGIGIVGGVAFEQGHAQGPRVRRNVDGRGNPVGIQR